MVDIKGGDEFYLDLYQVKEVHLRDAVSTDGFVNKVPHIENKFLINPPKSYLEKDNVEVIAHRRIKLQIMEVNKVGGRVAEQHYLIGMRIVEGNKTSPVFHIMVRNDKEFKEKIIKELEYYLKTSSLIT